MKLACCWANYLVQARLHIHVDVFQFVLPGELTSLDLPPDGRQPVHDEPCIVVADNTLAGQHLGVSH